MRTKLNLFGAALLVSGTTIGGGMLALPIVTAFAGLLPTILLFITVWLISLMSGLFLVKVSLASEKPTAHFLSLVENTLGKWGKNISVTAYLLLLYALTGAYLSGITTTLHTLIFPSHQSLSSFYSILSILTTAIVVLIILGAKKIDMLNRILMSVLIVSYIVLICFLPNFIQTSYLTYTNWPLSHLGVPIVITSFGYQIIVPSLTKHLNQNKKAIYQALIIGSVIPLLIYIIWEVMILGVIPLDGAYGFTNLWSKGGNITHALMHWIKNPVFSFWAATFTIVAMATSLLGVALSLSDFLLDTCACKNKKIGQIFSAFYTVIPPFLIILLYKQGFLFFLRYASIFVIILLIFFPTLMVRKLNKSVLRKSRTTHLVTLTMLILSVGLLLTDLSQRLEWFPLPIPSNNLDKKIS